MTAQHGEAFAASLELLADRHGDPTQAVYRRVFAALPETEALFVLDRTGAARGNMLLHALDALGDLAGPRHYGGAMLRAEMINHEGGLGVSREHFATFLDLVCAAVRELCGDGWSDAMEDAWALALMRAREACAAGEA